MTAGEPPLSDTTNAGAPPSGPGGHPTRIGPYRILSVLGEGGMGVVYLAEQTEPVARTVALKILKLGMDTRQVIARFGAERQALAVMDHPGIAKVFDAGATETGRPFFVMERVDGVPITHYCDVHRLGVRERVRLFAQVCRAVQHAHQKGVIHRDLKPSNVLVTISDGAPLAKVIDFGIAKAIDRGDSEETRLTQVDQWLGTPAYSSPEQVDPAGLDVDTRSDIYSLGVMLYELVAGVLPFDAPAHQGWSFYPQHLVRDPPAPSARFVGLHRDEQVRTAERRGTDPTSLRRQLRGELDWVVLRAMEKERERRYGTANALATELERVLANEPVKAGPPSRVYRARKFVRRHRVGVLFATALAVLLVGFAGITAVQAGRIERARDLAVVRQGQAEDLIGFMLGDLRRQLEPIGRLDLLDRIGGHALEYFAAVPESELSDEELFRRSEALSQLGQVRVAQGDLAAAEAAFRQSFALAQGLAARDSTNRQWQAGLGDAHYYLGSIPWRQGNLDAALEHFIPYLRIAERMVARDPDNLDNRLKLASANSNIGSVREARGDLDGALTAFRATLAIERELVVLDPSNLEWRENLAHTHNAVAVVQRKLGDLDDAARNHEAELALKRELVAQNPANQPWQRFLAIAFAYSGDLRLIRGDPEGALSDFQSSHTIYTALVAHDPSNLEWRRNLANTERLIGGVLVELRETTAALRELVSSRSRMLQLLENSPDNRPWQITLARTETGLARALLLAGRPNEALSAAGRALEISEAFLELTPDDVELRRLLSETYIARGEILARLGAAADASAAWTRGLDTIHSVARISRHTDLLALAATALLHLDRVQEAEPLIRELEQRGYRRPEFVEQVREKNVGL
jgi:eukaryotic-like serine/threonine-protein kinase